MNAAENIPKEVQLTPGEQLQIQTRPSVWLFFPMITLSVLLTAVSITIMILIPQLILILSLIILNLLVWLFLDFRYRTRYHLLVTNKRLIFFKKSLGVKLDDIHLEEVNDVKVDQGIIGRILNYGEVTVIRSRFTVMVEDPFGGIRNPFEVSGSIERAVASVKKE